MRVRSPDRSPAWVIFQHARATLSAGSWRHGAAVEHEIGCAVGEPAPTLAVCCPEVGEPASVIVAA